VAEPEGAAPGVDRILSKPFRLEALLGIIADLTRTDGDSPS
jgi:hypothetical protein